VFYELCAFLREVSSFPFMPWTIISDVPFPFIYISYTIKSRVKKKRCGETDELNSSIACRQELCVALFTAPTHFFPTWIQQIFYVAQDYSFFYFNIISADRNTLFLRYEWRSVLLQLQNNPAFLWYCKLQHLWMKRDNKLANYKSYWRTWHPGNQCETFIWCGYNQL